MSAQEREWHPGDKALLPVQFEFLAGDGVEVSYIGFGMRDRRTPIMVEARDLLRPVPAGGEVEAATEDAKAEAFNLIRSAMSSFGSRNDRARADRETTDRAARELREALAAAGLLAGGVPGRSEAETEWGWRLNSNGLTRTEFDEAEARHEVERFPGHRTLVCREVGPGRRPLAPPRRVTTVAEVFDFPGSSNRRCRCGGEWFKTEAITVDAATGSPTGYARPLVCADCGTTDTEGQD